MINNIPLQRKRVLTAQINMLEAILKDAKLVQEGWGAATSLTKYHANVDKEVAKSIEILAEAIQYSNESNYGPSPFEELLYSFNGHGVYGEEEIRQTFSSFFKAARAYVRKL